jgi:ribonuclease E
MKRILINATQEEELRMAMVDGQLLYDLNIELPASERKKANIYKGQITRIEPSLEAAFVDYGAERHGFLPLKDISSEYFVSDVESGSKPNIRNVLKEGQDIVVQIDKEERGNKGAALTTYVSLAGRFIVVKPNKKGSGGVSRRIVGEERDLARKSIREIEVPEGMSVILRTAGIDRSADELSWDLDNLLSVWEAIKKVVVEGPSPFLIYRESNAVVRVLRDYLTNDIGEILIDDEPTYKEAQEFVEQVMPHNLRKLKHYSDSVPLFTRYQIESQIESAFAHSVTLPSGGSLVIDHTEALVSIDINSARATKGANIETTALNTNLEAAEEVARQLRLRDLGGLIVIDFIDMGPQKNQRQVENRLRESVRQDRARVQLSKISRFGLLEMSRQRLRPSLGESSYLVCPRCSGIGNIRNVESLVLAILRIIGEEARKERTAKVIAQLPVEVATYLLNEKRDSVQSLESRHNTQVILVGNSALETPHYQIRRVRDDQVDLPENAGTSYTLIDAEDETEITQAMQDKKPAEVAAITTIVATTPAPPRTSSKKSGPGLLEKLTGLFSHSDKAPDRRKPRETKSGDKNSDIQRRGRQQSRKRGERQHQKKSKGPQRKKTGKKRQTARGPRQESGQREQAREQSAGPQKEQADSRNTQRQDGRQGSSKRRSRGGKRRKRSKDSPANSADKAAIEAKSMGNAADETAQKPESKQKTSRQERSSTDKTPDTAATSAADSGTPATKMKTKAPQKKKRAKAQKPAKPPISASQTEPPPSPRDSSYDETQPTLPKPKTAGDASAVTKPETDNDEARKKSANSAARNKTAKTKRQEAKPDGRLLPWEPNDPTTDGSPDKE